MAFWLFSAVGVVTLVMALKIAGAGGDGWIEGFGSMEYDVLCTLLPSYATEMMSDSWCSECELGVREEGRRGECVSGVPDENLYHDMMI